MEKIITDYYESIIDILQKSADKFVDEYYAGDECRPEVLLSIYSDEGQDKIVITLCHLGDCFTNVVFPREDRYYGYDSLNYMIEDMYSRTM